MIENAKKNADHLARNRNVKDCLSCKSPLSAVSGQFAPRSAGNPRSGDAFDQLNAARSVVAAGSGLKLSNCAGSFVHVAIVPFTSTACAAFGT